MSLLIIWFFLVLLASVIHFPSIPSDLPDLPFDKIAHFVMYGITSIAVFRVLIRTCTPKRALLLAVIISAGYGLFMEVIQSFIPWRSFELLDQAANTLGAAMTGLAYKRVWFDKKG
jgi:VanZ family protein